MAEHPRAGAVARRDVPTCRLDEPMDEIRERVRAAGWDACVVVNEEGVVLGLLRDAELERGGEERVEQVMRPGPSTFRPHVPIEEMAHFMMDHDLPTSPVTSSDGRLLGVLRREMQLPSHMDGTLTTTPLRGRGDVHRATASGSYLHAVRASSAHVHNSTATTLISRTASLISILHERGQPIRHEAPTTRTEVNLRCGPQPLPPGAEPAVSHSDAGLGDPHPSGEAG